MLVGVLSGSDPAQPVQQEIIEEVKLHIVSEVRTAVEGQPDVFKTIASFYREPTTLEPTIEYHLLKFEGSTDFVPGEKYTIYTEDGSKPRVILTSLYQSGVIGEFKESVSGTLVTAGFGMK
jgi:hypothetical protein